MVNDEVVAVEEQEGLFRNPFPAALAGLGATFLALVLSLAAPAYTVVWAPILILGLLAAATAVAIRPRSLPVYGAAFVTSILASFLSVNADWDPSASLFFGVLAVVSLVAANVIMLPRSLQKVVVSLLLLFHFAGILSAVTSAHPSSWLSHQVWTRIFRPYLQFMYLNNAYHFYAPDPGPASLLWFRIEYEPDTDADGNVTRRYYRWVEVPRLDDSGRQVDYDAFENLRSYPAVNFTRRLSLCEGVNQPGPPNPPPDAERQRLQAGQLKGIPTMPAGMGPLATQYREPGTLAKHWLKSYAKRVAHVYKHKDEPERPVKSVKVYRVLHRLLSAPEYAGGKQLYDPLTYEPVFLGEYAEDGELLSRKITIRRAEDGSPYLDDEFRDPFLYWVIPILEDPNGAAALNIYAEPAPNGGVRVKEVMRGRAAHLAGIQKGDVILSVNGQPVDTLTELRSQILQHKLGTMVHLRVRRDGKVLDIDVQLMIRVINYLKIHAGDTEEGEQL